MPLTDTAIRNTKPGAKAQRLFDGGGLYLEIAPSGGRWWRLKYRFGGKEKRLSLGTYPDTSLKAARDRRDDARQLLATGSDPGEQRKSDKLQKQLEAERAFKRVALAWLDHQTARWAPTTKAAVLASLEADANTKPLLPGPGLEREHPEQRPCTHGLQGDCHRPRLPRLVLDGGQ